MIIVSIKASSHKNTLTGSVAFKKLRHRQNDYENVSDEDDNVYTSNSTVTVSQMSKFPEGEPQLAMQVLHIISSLLYETLVSFLSYLIFFNLCCPSLLHWL